MRLLTVVVLLAVSGWVAAGTVRLSAAVEVGPGYEVFGAPMIDKSAGRSLSELVSAADKHAGQTVRLTTRIAKVCQKKGCFFIATEGQHWARITFKDYEFFTPTDSAGMTATLQGVFTQQVLSPERAAHYAADLGEAEFGDRSPLFEYLIVATSVLVGSLGH